MQDLYVSFRHALGIVRAVNGISFKVRKGEILGIVGESGCGKSVMALSILRLVPIPPGRIDRGAIFLRTEDKMVDVTKLPSHGQEIRKIRGKEVSMIFQEPMRSLHPMFTVGEQIIEGLFEHTTLTRKEALEKAVYFLETVGLAQPKHIVNEYPHQLSGGMRQRIMIAIALACSPHLLIADEPTTALDVTIQAQILELMKKLQTDLAMSIILVTHNLGVIAEMVENVLVMYLGTIMEYADVEGLFNNPMHPYTRKLLEVIPSLASVPKTKLQSLRGVVPELFEIPKSCVFADRCDQTSERCKKEPPPVIEVEPSHKVRCWLYA